MNGRATFTYKVMSIRPSYIDVIKMCPILLDMLKFYLVIITYLSLHISQIINVLQIKCILKQIYCLLSNKFLN